MGSPFSYTVTLTGGCGTVTETGTITVTDENTIALSSAVGTDAQTVCVSNSITDITYATTGATGGTVTGLPTGVTGTWASGIFTITGTPTGSVGSPFSYTVTLTGGCGTVTETGTITVTPLPVYVDFTSNCTGATLDNVEVNATAPSGTLEYSLDDITYQTSNVFTGLTSGNSYTFYVRIVGTTCSVNSSLQSVSCNCSVVSDNTIGSSQTICEGDIASAITGSVPTITPSAPSTYQWQSSVDNSSWSDITGETSQDYSPGTLTQTTYFRRVVKMVGCPDNNSSSIEITVTPLPVYVDFISNCTGATLDNVEINATAPSGTLEYSLDDVTYQTSNVFTGLTSGNSYTFYVRIIGTTCSVNSGLETVSCNCSVVTDNTIGSPETICEGDVASALIGSVPTITPLASSTYQWQSSLDNSTWLDISGGTTQDYSPGALTQTTYFRRVVKMAGCPDDNSSSVEITVYPLPVYVDFTSNCTGATLDNVEINATTTSGTLEYSIDDVTYQTSNVFTGLTSGNSYTFYIRTVGTTCSVNSGLETVSCNCSVVTDNTIGSTETICEGDVASTLTGSVPTITPSASSTYQWQSSIDNSTWSDIIGETSQDYSPGALTQTTYFRRVVKMVGCPDDNSASIEITVNPLPVYVDFTSNCTGATLDNVEVNATTTSGTLEYSLDGITYQASNVFTGLTPGNSYTFYIRIVGTTCSVNSGLETVSCNCSVVTDNTIGSTETICEGDVASTLTGSVPTITPSASSTYQWQSSIDNSTWSDIIGETSQDYSPGALTQTTYFRRVVKMVGCPDDNSASIEITVNPLPVYVDFTSNCTGATLDNVEVNATTTSGTLEYSLDDITYQASNVFASLISGNSYTFYVRLVGTTCSVNSGLQTVNCNCSVVTGNTVGAPEIICEGDVASALIGSVPTITPLASSTYQWQSSLDNSTWSDIAVGTSQDYSPGALTQTTYFRRVVKMVGCPDDNSATVEVTVIPTIIAEAGVDDEIVCLPSSVDLDGTGSTVSGVDYLWTGPAGGILFGETTLSPTVNIGGVYTLTVTDQINGCSASDIVTITENNTPPTVITQSASTVITCDNPVITIDGTLSSQGTNWSYSWDEINNNGNILTPDDAQTIDIDAPGTYRLFVFDFNTLCIDFSTIVITEDLTTLNLQVTPVPDVCQSEDSLDLSSFVNISGGEYSGSGISSASSPILDLTASTGINSIDYTVVNPSNGCSTTEVIDVNILANPVIAFSADTTEGCLPLQVTFTDDNPEVADLCVWDFGDGNQSNSCGSVSNTYNAPSCFDVSLTKTFANGCSSSETLASYICANPKPVSDFIADNNEVNSMDTKVQFENYSIDGDEFIWDFGDDVAIDDPTLENPEHEFPENEALYNVTLIAISDRGCRDTSTVAVRVIEEEVYYMPNSFTPNGDGINQVFKPEFSTGVSLEDFSLYIYNRWGEIVFESHDINRGWDGTYGVGGDVLQSGLYIWTMVIKAKTSDKVTQVSGQVNLLK